MLVRAFVLGCSAGNDLGIAGLDTKRVWIGVKDSTRAPTIGSTGSIHESGKVTE